MGFSGVGAQGVAKSPHRYVGKGTLTGNKGACPKEKQEV
jgi:hypothetical protein